MRNLQALCKRHLLVHLHATNKCNLNCTYCYNRVSNRVVEITPSYDAGSLVDVLSQYADALDIVFYGGEPLLNPDFIGRVIVALDRKEDLQSQCHVVTNGTIPFDTLAASGIASRLSSVWVSFDGTKETIARSRGEGVYDAIVANLAGLAKTFDGVLVARMTHTLGSDLIGNVYEAGRYFPHVYFQCDNTLTSRQAEQLACGFRMQFPNLLNAWLSDFRAGSCQWLPANVLGLWHLMRVGRPAKYYHCSPGKECLTIDSAGTVFSCPEGEAPESHSAKENCNLGNIFTGFTFRTHPIKRRCMQCTLFGICGGRCIWSDNEHYCSIVASAISAVQESHDMIADALYSRRISEAALVPSLYSEILP